MSTIALKTPPISETHFTGFSALIALNVPSHSRASGAWRSASDHLDCRQRVISVKRRRRSFTHKRTYLTFVGFGGLPESVLLFVQRAN